MKKAFELTIVEATYVTFRMAHICVVGCNGKPRDGCGYRGDHETSRLCVYPKKVVRNARELEEWTGFIERHMKSSQSAELHDGPATAPGQPKITEGPPPVK